MKPSAIRSAACVKAAAVAVAVSLSLSLSFAAFADEHADVVALIKSGKHTEAIARAEKAIAKSPMDAQMRFTKGLAQAEAGRTADAIVTFSRLTEDFPALPEPYNNLAVLYASQGQFEKARATLESALRTNPSYATAYENLGDVYARLASQAYSSALQLDAGNNTAKPKLALIHEMFAGPVAAASSAQAARSRSASGAVSAVSTPVAAPVAQAAPAVPASPAPSSAVAMKPASRPVAVASAPAPASPAAAAPAAASTAKAEQDVRSAVADWSAAWSARDVSGYLAAYAGDFKPGKGMSHAAWAAERRARIMGKKHISVQIEQLKVNVEDNRATAHFRQVYKADSLNVSSRKTLEFARSGSHWVIVKESTGD